jgi:hypothetical protein
MKNWGMAIAHDNKEQQCTTMKRQGVVTTPNNHEQKQSPIKNSKKRTNQTIIKQMKTLY